MAGEGPGAGLRVEDVRTLPLLLERAWTIPGRTALGGALTD